MYDVIVIGAGPAGSAAAKELAERGFRVLLTERFTLPRYKSCSGQLIRKTLRLVEEYFGEPVPESALCSPPLSKGMIFTNDKGREFRFEQEGLNVWRSAFDEFLARKAEAAGAELRDGCAAVSCGDSGGCVTVSFSGGSAEQARMAIDCEGAAGSLRKRLTSKRPRYVVTYQTFNNGSVSLDPHYFYAYLQPELSGYDAWFNVKDGKLVLGVSDRNSAELPRHYRRFAEYMKRRHGLEIFEQKKAEKWLMPLVERDHAIEYGVGRVLFAGEAAGFLNPMGEGISAALESGHCAARAAAEHLGDPEAARGMYIAALEELCAYMKRQWSFVGSIAETFSDMRQP